MPRLLPAERTRFGSHPDSSDHELWSHIGQGGHLLPKGVGTSPGGHDASKGAPSCVPELCRVGRVPGQPLSTPASVTASRGPGGVSATACVSSGNGVRGRKVLLVHLRGCVSAANRGQVHIDGWSLLRPLQAEDGTDQHEQDGHLQEHQENVVVPARGDGDVRALGPQAPSLPAAGQGRALASPARPVTLGPAAPFRRPP